RRTGCCVLAFGTAADLAPRPVVPLRIGTTTRRHVLNQADAVASQAAARGHAGRLQVRAAFERGDARLGSAKAHPAVGAHLPLGPDVPLGKLLVRGRRWAVHACKGRAYGTLGAESGAEPPRFQACCAKIARRWGARFPAQSGQQVVNTSRGSLDEV